MRKFYIRTLVKTTAPVIRTHGISLSRHFYARMFEHNPELKPLFNQSHQKTGAQQQALAMAVVAYAEHIDNPMVLAPVLELIANKHVSLGVRQEHYAIVGGHLLASIREVLGGEVATDELIAAWAAAYGQLADVLVGMEDRLYKEAATQAGGWSGWRGFKVAQKKIESDEITSFYLMPADGGAVPTYRPGQYVTIRAYLPELGMHQPRQYSLSTAPGHNTLRISVKRESANAAQPAGMMSSFLHDQISEGSILDVASPMGDFVLADGPAVLISAGVGVTPMISMLEYMTQHTPKRSVLFIHACRHGGVHAFRDHVRDLARRHAQVRTIFYYESPRIEDVQGKYFDHSGRINLLHASIGVLNTSAHYYLCGPYGFMQIQKTALQAAGVPISNIRTEEFGVQQHSA